jgi:hypothetical protein
MLYNSNNAQTNFKISEKYLLFEDAISGEPILMYNDSMLVRGFDFKTHIKTKFPENLDPLEFNNYQYKIDSLNYLVDNGCGPVVTFYDNSFKRIDNSFRHRNQYRAIPFEYKNKMYLWSGYGLFTYKNILTHYDFTTKEWQQEQQQNFKDMVPRMDAVYLKKDSNLYVFGGYNNDTDLISQNSKKIENFVWRLDLKTFSWHRGKQYKTNSYFSKLIPKESLQIQIEDKVVIVSDLLTEINLFQNTVETYKIKNFKNIYKIIYHAKTKTVSYTFYSNGELHIVNELYQDFRGKLVKTEPFYKTIIEYTFLKISLAILCLLLFLWIVKTYLNQTKTKKRKIIYLKKKDVFLLTSKTPINLNTMNFNVLKFFLKNKNTFSPINSLNDILSLNVSNENYTTTNKRRERVLKDLTFELSTLLNLDKDSIFITRSSDSDRRIKEIKLNIDIIVK